MQLRNLKLENSQSSVQKDSPLTPLKCIRITQISYKNNINFVSCGIGPHKNQRLL